MIVDRLEDWTRDGMPSDANREALARIIMEAAARQALSNFLPNAPKEPRPPVTLSSHFYCPRQIHYDLTGADKEALAPRAYDAFAYGHAVEALVVAKCVLAGLPVEYPSANNGQFRGNLVFDGDPLRGSVDMVLNVDGVRIPVEIKSMADFGFDKAKKEGVENTFGYLDQLQNYIAMLKAPYGIFICVKKSTGHMIEQHVKPDEAAVARAEQAYAAAKRGLPPRPEWATTRVVASPGGKVERVEDVRCGYCSRRAVCWEGFDQAVVSGKPVWQRPLKEE